MHISSTKIDQNFEIFRERKSESFQQRPPHQRLEAISLMKELPPVKKRLTTKSSQGEKAQRVRTLTTKCSQEAFEYRGYIP
jgi:hypothetical protein